MSHNFLVLSNKLQHIMYVNKCIVVICTLDRLIINSWQNIRMFNHFNKPENLPHPYKYKVNLKCKHKVTITYIINYLDSEKKDNCRTITLSKKCHTASIPTVLTLPPPDTLHRQWLMFRRKTRVQTSATGASPRTAISCNSLLASGACWLLNNLWLIKDVKDSWCFTQFKNFITLFMIKELFLW